MNISPKKLQVISCLAQTLSFSRTADIFCTTQPSLSRIVRSVEQELGCQIFIRTTRHVELTQQGRMLLPIVNKLVQDYERGILRLREATQGKRPTITIAALPSLCALILPGLLIELKKSLSDFVFSVQEAHACHAVDLVRSGKADFAVCGVDYIDPDLSFIVVQEDRFVLLCDQSDSLRYAVKVWDERLINDLPVVSMEQGTNARDYIDMSFKKVGMEFRPIVELTNLLSIAQFVRQGFGVGLIPELGAKALIDGGLCIKYLENAPKRKLGIIRKQSDGSPEYMHMMADFLRSALINVLK
ncbi:LysR family transcriptional regulator [Alcaligenaceae bacterium]|nr:LysR family transcriptional regulator [Alcaligenaceae bacterium]